MANMVIDKQAQRMLGKRRRNRRWIPVVACLVLVVAVGTFYFMMQQGQAMAWRDMELDCLTSVHAHTEACFDEEGRIVCGLADYLVHEHGDECYDREGNLACQLRQVKEHHHDEACYEKVNVATACGLDENVGHVHSDACYEAVLACGMEEAPSHSHTTDCYDENDELICGLEEAEGHSHTEECYEKELTCTIEAGEGGHLHTDACMVGELVLTCPKPEISLHKHADECYDFYDENGELLPLEEAIEREERFAKQVADGEELEFELPLRALKCGMLQTEEHVHGNECFKKIEQEPESEVLDSGLESSGLESSELESSGLESSSLESSALESSDLESSSSESSDLESSEIESGLESSGLESSSLESEPESSQPEEEVPEEPAEPEGSSTVAYEDETLKVTAEFVDGQPEGAHLVVERLEDADQLAKKQAKLKRTMEDEDYSLHALLQVGLQDENGEEVEFDGAVSLTAEFFGEGAGAEGANICAVAYRQAEEDLELETVPGMVLDMEKAVSLPVALGANGGAVTEIEEATLLGFASKAPVRVNADDVEDGEDEDGPAEDNTLHLDQSFSYSTESKFELVFHIQGDAELAVSESPAEPEETVEPSSEPEIFWGEDAPAEVEPDEPVMAGMSDIIVSSIESASSLAEPDEAVSSTPEESQGESAPSAEPEPTPEPKKKLGGTVSTGSVLPANTELVLEQPLQFVVEQVQDGDPAYKPYAEYVQIDEEESAAEIPPLEVLAYKMFYAGQELDLSGCEVTVEVKATPELEELVAELVGSEEPDDEGYSEVAMLVSVLGPADGAQQEPSYTIYADADAAAAAQEKAEAEAALREVVEGKFDASANSDVCVLDSKDLTRESSGVLMSLRLKSASADAMGAAVDESDQAEPDAGVMAMLDEPEVMLLLGTGTTTDNTLALASNTSLNPHFTVEYYSYLDRVVRNTTGDNSKDLPVINTDNNSFGTGGSLPKNGNTTNPTGQGLYYLKRNTDGSLVTNNELTQIYGSKQCQYFTMPNLKYFDAVANSGAGQGDSYRLMQIWVGDKNSNLETSGGNLNPEGWTIYGKQYDKVIKSDKSVYTLDPDNCIDDPNDPNSNNECIDYLHFTNRADSVGKDKNGHIYIQIEHEAVIRLVYAPEQSEFPADANFYDYDIGGGWEKQGDTLVLNTKQQGVNNPNNYTGSGAKYAFGNGESTVKTDLGGVKWEKGGSNTLNQGNANGFGGCTFGIVTEKLTNGVLQFDSEISAPDIFCESTENKTGISDPIKGGLKFKRIGDTYTLTSATATDTVSELDILKYYRNNWNKTKKIYSNEFWPLDKHYMKKKGVFDEDHDFEFVEKSQEGSQQSGYLNEKGDIISTKQSLPTNDYPDADGYNLPVGDGYHNPYFGMHTSLTFELVKEYVGPLEYLFFGDDDMWVFLTPINNGVANYGESKLICDIGGVHSSVGEYVNLWNYVYVQKEKDGTVHATNQEYQLDFYYTERGASGSTCWMQFILPSVRAQDTDQTPTTGNLRIEKVVNASIQGGNLGTRPWDGYDADETFLFRLKLTDSSDKPLTDNHAYVKYRIKTGEEEEDPSVPFSADITEKDEIDDASLSGFLEKSALAGDGVTFMLKTGQYIVIEGLPLHTKYEVEELTLDGRVYVKDYLKQQGDSLIKIIGTKSAYDYATESTVTKVANKDDNEPRDGGGRVVTGTINYASLRSDKDDIQTVKFTNTALTYELPKTGGSGTGRYIWAGAAVCVAGLALIYMISRKRGKEVVHKA